MSPTPIPSRIAAAAATALLAVAGLVAGIATPANAASVDYVALGDSYSSGMGASGTSGACKQSNNAYGPLWKAANKPASFKFVACGGAVTADIRNDQVNSLSTGTDLISLTIGGNDAGFGTVATTCVLGTDDICSAAVATARAFITGVLPGRLDSTYAAIRGKSPSATVVVLGYPRLFEESATCGITGLSLAKRRAMNLAADDLASVIGARARAANFRFVDVRSYFAGHSVCASSEWITRVNPLDAGSSYHPNNNGYAKGYLPAFSSVAG